MLAYIPCMLTYLSSMLASGWPRTLENRENRENNEKIPCVEKSGNLIKIRKSGKNQGILQVLWKKNLTSGGFFFFKILNLMRIHF